MEASKVLAVLNGVVWQQLSTRNKDNGPEPSTRPRHRNALNQEEYVAKLIQIMIEQLAQTTAIICPSSLLAVDGI